MSYKLKQRIAAFVGAIAFMGVGTTVSYVHQVCAIEKSSNVICSGSLGISLDSDLYVKGDTVTATVTLGDLSKAVENNIQIAAFEAHFVFDNQKLEFLPEDSAFSNIFSSSDTAVSEKYINVSENYSDRLVAYFAYSSGGYQLNADNNSSDSSDYCLEVAKLKFKVKDTVKKGDKIKVGFDTNPTDDGSDELRYDNIVMQPLNGSIRPNDALFTLTITSGSEAEITDIVFKPQNGSFLQSQSKISVPVTVKASSDYKSVYFVAELYDDTTGLTKDVVFKDVRSLDSSSFNVEFQNIKSTENLNIKYYLWDSLSTMQPITSPLDGAVVGE